MLVNCEGDFPLCSTNKCAVGRRLGEDAAARVVINRILILISFSKIETKPIVYVKHVGNDEELPSIMIWL